MNRAFIYIGLLVLLATSCGYGSERYSGYGMYVSDDDGLLFVETPESAAARHSGHREAVWLRNLGREQLGKRIDIRLGRSVEDSFPARSKGKVTGVRSSGEERKAVLSAIAKLEELHPGVRFRIDEIATAEGGGEWKLELAPLDDDGEEALRYKMTVRDDRATPVLK